MAPSIDYSVALKAENSIFSAQTLLIDGIACQQVEATVAPSIDQSVVLKVESSVSSITVINRWRYRCF